MTSRRRGTYLTRVGAAGLALLAMLWLMLVNSFNSGTAVLGKTLFDTLSGVAFAYCLLVGVRITSDCLSAEKREGTLGLLFLTDLRGYDLVLGKLASSSLTSVYGLLATVPVLALAMLLGGVSLSQVLMLAVVLFNTMFFSLSAGLLASTLSKNERKAAFATFVLVAFFSLFPGVVLMFVHEFLDIRLADEIDAVCMLPSPLLSCLIIFKIGPFGSAPFPIWVAMVLTHLLGWMFIAIASWVLPRVAHERPQSRRGDRWMARLRAWSYGEGEERLRFRRRLLDLNPFTWLSSRERYKAHYVWLFLGILFLMWVASAWKYPNIFFVWEIAPGALWLLHGFVKVWFASEVCQRLIEDRRAGALELLLSTPLSVREIAQGQSLALRRQFQGPVIALLVVDAVTVFFAPPLATDDQRAMVIMFPAAMVVFLLDLWTIQWLGMWKSLSSTSLNRVLGATYGRVLLLPWLLFFVFGSGIAGYQFLTGRSAPVTSVVLVLVWAAFSIIVDLVQVFSARAKFLAQFRTLAAARFDSPAIQPGKDSRLSFLRAIFSRSAQPEPATPWTAILRRHWFLTSTGLVLMVGILSVVIYRSHLRRELRKELAAISARGEPAFPEDIDKWFPPIPDEENATAQLVPFLNISYRVASTNLELAVTRNADTLKQVRQIVKLPRSRMAISWSDPFSSQIYMQLQNLSGLPLLLHGEASMLLRTNDTEGALESAEALFHLGRVFAQTPLSTAQYQRFGCITFGLQAVEELLNSRLLSRQQLNRLMTLLRQVETETLDGDRWTRAWIAQRYLLIVVHERSSSFGFNPWGAAGIPPYVPILMSVQSAVGVSDRSMLKSLRRMTEEIAALKKPFPQNLQEMQAYRGNDQFNPITTPFFGWFGGLSNFDPGGIMHDISLINRTRLAEIAVAIELARLGSDAIPRDLKSLAPAFIEAVPVPLNDPRPFTLEHLDHGYRVFLGTKAPVVKPKGRSSQTRGETIITVGR